MDVDATESAPAFWADFVVMLFFMMDICVKFNEAFKDPHGKMVVNRSAIARRYLRGWFLLDLASTIPWDYMSAGSGGARLIRILRVFKLLRLLRTNRLIEQIMRQTSMKMSVWFCLSTAIQAVVLVHWLSCCWMVVGLLNREHGWMTKYENADFSRKLLKTSGGGSATDDSDGNVQWSWYVLCVEWSLGSLGIWPYDVPGPRTTAGMGFEYYGPDFDCLTHHDTRLQRCG